jgi:hypothetical protein
MLHYAKDQVFEAHMDAFDSEGVRFEGAGWT